eukprot:605056-Rhodomonas_salina.1
MLYRTRASVPDMLCSTYVSTGHRTNTPLGRQAQVPFCAALLVTPGSRIAYISTGHRIARA